MRYWVYILRCKDGSLYTGSTGNLEKRIALHNSGKGAKYTRGRAPLVLLYKEECSDRGEALRREAAIKKCTRVEKLALIKDS
jgi:pyrroline-5-carboxylate reductase